MLRKVEARCKLASCAACSIACRLLGKAVRHTCAILKAWALGHILPHLHAATKNWQGISTARAASWRCMLASMYVRDHLRSTHRAVQLGCAPLVRRSQHPSTKSCSEHTTTAGAHRRAARHVDLLLVLRHVARPHAPLLANGAIRPPAGGDHPLAGLAGRGRRAQSGRSGGSLRRRRPAPADTGALHPAAL